MRQMKPRQLVGGLLALAVIIRMGLAVGLGQVTMALGLVTMIVVFVIGVCALAE